MKRAGAEPPDEVLVIASILGNLSAFDDLALRYRSAVVRLAESIAGREYAEDVAQDSLLLAFKALPSIEDPEKFASWLAAITRHRALRFIHRERARASVQVELDDLLREHLIALTPPISLENQDGEEMRLALENVPADYSLALRLHFLDEMPIKRIAAFLNVPSSTVKWRIYKGKKLLREQIESLRKVES
jgi:RNA polymerase sigma-70 factor, ECF subfamily